MYLPDIIVADADGLTSLFQATRGCCELAGSLPEDCITVWPRYQVLAATGTMASDTMASDTIPADDSTSWHILASTDPAVNACYDEMLARPFLL